MNLFIESTRRVYISAVKRLELEVLPFTNSSDKTTEFHVHFTTRTGHHSEEVTAVLDLECLKELSKQIDEALSYTPEEELSNA